MPFQEAIRQLKNYTLARCANLKYPEAPTSGISEFDPSRPIESAATAIKLYDSLFPNTTVPTAVIANTRKRILTTYHDWVKFVGTPKQQQEFRDYLTRIGEQEENVANDKPAGDYAFLVHPRDMKQVSGVEDEFGDIPRQFPALQQVQGVDFEEIIKLFNLLPGGFRLCSYKALKSDTVVGTLMCAPVILSDLMKRGLMDKDPLKRLKAVGLARRRLTQAFYLGKAMGLRCCGLGEIFGAASKHGITLEQEFYPDGPVPTTGHALTTMLIEDTLKRATRELKEPEVLNKPDDLLKGQSVTIIGGGGAIGASVAVDLASQVRQIVLEDRVGKGRAINKISSQT